MLLSKHEDLSEEPNTHEKSCVATLRAESLVVWRMETGVLLGPTSPDDSQSFNEKPCLKGIRWGESVGQSVSGLCSCVKAHRSTKVDTHVTHRLITCTQTYTQIDLKKKWF